MWTSEKISEIKHRLCPQVTCETFPVITENTYVRFKTIVEATNDNENTDHTQ